MTPDARRIEELSLNSSAPPGQLVYDGWLLRLAAGKAKRARSVNAVYESRLPVAQKIDYCERLYAGARLPAIFRLTPFVQPPCLDGELERRGYLRFETTSVQSACVGEHGPASAAQVVELSRWVDEVGELRGSPAEHRASHLARLQGMPLALRAVVLREAGRVVATGLVMAEDDCAGLFDIVTRESVRRRGHGRAVVASLLHAARELGCRHAYLQVGSDNEPARRLYAGFGFVQRYEYWYRGRPSETW
jgi:GNAT superfamily N-acetyltransferase